MRLSELKGDLFADSEPDAALAHCVSADLRMGRGIAADFRARYGRLDELRRQGRGVGEVAHVRVPGAAGGARLIAHLVTKPRYYDKPTYASLRASLEALRRLCLAEGVARLAMPRISCGLDRLEWPLVRQAIEEVFADTEISIAVFSL